MDWIKTEEFVPEHGVVVIVCDVHSGFISLGRYHEDDHVFDLMNIEKIEADSCATPKSK